MRLLNIPPPPPPLENAMRKFLRLVASCRGGGGRCCPDDHEAAAVKGEKNCENVTHFMCMFLATYVLVQAGLLLSLPAR